MYNYSLVPVPVPWVPSIGSAEWIIGYLHHPEQALHNRSACVNRWVTSADGALSQRSKHAGSTLAQRRTTLGQRWSGVFYWLSHDGLQINGFTKQLHAAVLIFKHWRKSIEHTAGDFFFFFSALLSIPYHEGWIFLSTGARYGINSILQWTGLRRRRKWIPGPFCITETSVIFCILYCIYKL